MPANSTWTLYFPEAGATVQRIGEHRFRLIGWWECGYWFFVWWILDSGDISAILDFNAVEELPTIKGEVVTPSDKVYPWGTTFTFSATYTDKSGAAPDYVKVFIGGVGYEMEFVSGDHEHGATYKYKWVTDSNDVGTYTYYYEARDPAGDVWAWPDYPKALTVRKRNTTLTVSQFMHTLLITASPAMLYQVQVSLKDELNKAVTGKQVNLSPFGSLEDIGNGYYRLPYMSRYVGEGEFYRAIFDGDEKYSGAQSKLMKTRSRNFLTAVQIPSEGYLSSMYYVVEEWNRYDISKIHLKQGQTITIDYSSSYTGRQIRLYTPDQVFIKSSNSTGTRQTLAHTATSTGDYYLEIYAVSTTTIGEYQVEFSIAPGPAQFAAASPLDLGTTTGNLSEARSEDIYKKYFSAGELIAALMRPGSDFDLYLYDPSQTLVAASITRGPESESISYVTTVSGYHYIRVYRHSGSGFYSLAVDTTSPLAPTLAEIHSGRWTNGFPSWRWSAADPETGIAQYEVYCSWNGGTFYTTDTSYHSTLADGTHYIKVRAQNGAGLWSEWSGAVYVHIDTVPPTSSVNTISPYWQSELPLTITATASDDRSGVGEVMLLYKYSDDGANWGGWQLYGIDSEWPWSWSFDAPEDDGYYQFGTLAIDRAGNVEEGQVESRMLTGSLRGEAGAEFEYGPYEVEAPEYEYGGNPGNPDNSNESYLIWIEVGGENFYGYWENGGWPSWIDVTVMGVDLQVRVEVEEIWGGYWIPEPVGEWVEELEGFRGRVWLLEPVQAGNIEVVSVEGNIKSEFAESDTYDYIYAVWFDLFGDVDVNIQIVWPEATASVLVLNPIELGEAATDTISTNRPRYYGFDVNTPPIRPTLDWQEGDLDLHLYDPEERHVGWNYETNELELEIPGAEYSGRDVKPEWIRVPEPQPGFWVAMLYPYELEGETTYTLEVFADASPPESTVKPIEPYWQNAGMVPFEVSVSASDTALISGEVPSGVKNVGLWYRYSTDNLMWSDWALYDMDNSEPYSWTFDVPAGDGFYEFYSVATDRAGNREEAPDTADAQAGVDMTPPESFVNPIEPYWQNANIVPFEVAAAASDVLSGVERVSLWYRYSPDNVAWGQWTPFGTDEAAPWGRTFNASEGEGFYEFSSMAIDTAGNAELLEQVFVEDFAFSLDDEMWSVGKVGVKYDSIQISDDRLKLSARAARAGEYGAIYAVSNEPLDLAQGWVIDVQMAVPTDNAPGDFRSEFYLAPTFTTSLNPHSLPDWLRVSTSVNREGVRWMLQRKRVSARVGLGTIYTSGPTHKLGGTWRIVINSENLAVWLDGQLVENWRLHELPFTSAHMYLVERTKVAPVYTVSFDHVRVQEFSADTNIGVDITPPESSVNLIEPYWQESVPFEVSATAFDALSGVASVELYYRSSIDNVTWSEWKSYGTNDAAPYEWSFNAPYGYALYEFYSAASDAAGNIEGAPGGIQILGNPSFELPGQDGVIPEGWSVIPIEGEGSALNTDWIQENGTQARDGSWVGKLYYRATNTSVASWLGVAAEQTSVIFGPVDDSTTNYIEYYLNYYYNREVSGLDYRGAMVEVEFVSGGESYKLRYIHTYKGTPPSDNATVKYIDMGPLSYNTWTTKQSRELNSDIAAKFGTTPFTITAVRVGPLIHGTTSSTGIGTRWDNVVLIRKGVAQEADARCGVVVPATVDIDPDTLNLRSRGKWVTAYIELPPGYGVEHVEEEPYDLEVEVEGELTPRQQELVNALVQEIERTLASVELEIDAEEGEVEVEVEGYLSEEGVARLAQGVSPWPSPSAKTLLSELVEELEREGSEVEISIEKEVDWGNYRTTIDISSVMLENVPAVSDPKYGFVMDPELEDRDGDDLPELMVKFDRAVVQALVSVGDLELTVAGKWHAVLFRGSDVIRVIEPGVEQQDHGDKPEVPPGQSGEHPGQGQGNQGEQQGNQGQGQGPPQTPPGQGGQSPDRSNGRGNGNQGQGNQSSGQNQGKQGNLGQGQGPSQDEGNQSQGDSGGNQGGEQGQGKAKGNAT